ncbi:MAG: hypothetical protein MJ078_03475, partial [Clostridia bacterium]|nr:hypothetical protein [Clostridia bacterium]
ERKTQTDGDTVTLRRKEGEAFVPFPLPDGYTPGTYFFGGREEFSRSFYRFEGQVPEEFLPRGISAAEEGKRVLQSVIRQIGSGEAYGALRVPTERIEELERQRDTRLAEEKELLALQKELLEVRRKSKEASAEYEKFTKLVYEQQHATLIKEYDRLGALEEEYAREKDALETFRETHSRNGFFPDDAYFGMLTKRKTAYLRAAEKQEQAKQEDILAEQRLTAAEESVGAASAVFVPEGGEDKTLALVRKRVKDEARCLVVGGTTLFFGLASLRFALFSNQADTAFWILTAEFGLLSLYLFLRFLVVFRNQKVFFRLLRQKDRMSLEKAVADVKRKKSLADVARWEAEKARELYYLAEENKGRERIALSALLAKSGKEWAEQDPDSAVEEMSTECRGVLEEYNRRSVRTKEIQREIQDLRKTLSDYNEVIIRAAVSPAERDRLASMKGKDLSQGALLYRSLEEEYRKRQEALEEKLSRRQNGLSPASLQEEILRLEAKKQKLSAYGEVLREAEAQLTRLVRETEDVLTEKALKLNDFLTFVTEGKYGCRKSLCVLELTENGVSLPVLYAPKEVLALSGLGLRCLDREDADFPLLPVVACIEEYPVYGERILRYTHRRFGFVLLCSREREA